MAVKIRCFFCEKKRPKFCEIQFYTWEGDIPTLEDRPVCESCTLKYVDPPEDK